uniref:SAP domain-containing protein n=1 Tax=Manihot esculenta TaxID=3983 RepID=A0A2C9WHE5_MANES
MDFYSLKRKQLQALCKKHGIPANTTNLEMAERLTASLKVNGIATSEEGNEKNSKDAPKKLKKVRFRPDNETREYVPSAYRKPEGRRRRATLVNPVSKELGQSNLSENVVRKKRERGSEKIESDCRITRSRARVDNETFSVLQKSRASQEGEASKNIARDSVEARKGFRRSKRNMAKCTDSEIMKVDVVSRITRSGAQFAGNSSTVGGKGENEVFGVAKECEGAVRIKKLSEGLSRNGSRRKSVAQHNDEVESYGQEVLKEARKKSMNLNFANVNEVNASLASTERTEKVSITAAGQRRSRRKAAVVNSTAAIDEHGIGESIGKVKKSNENVLREDAKVSNELRRSTRNASRQCSQLRRQKPHWMDPWLGNPQEDLH